MLRRLFGTVAALAVLGALAIGAVAYAANAPSSPRSAPSSAPAYMPAASHSHSGNCPNMGGGSSPGSSSSGASQSNL